MPTVAAAVSALHARLAGSSSVLLTGPEGPDGDSIGACLALQRILAVALPGLEVRVAGRPAARYAGLPGAGAMVPDAEVRPADGVIVLDGDCTRLAPPVAAAFAAAAWRGLVDHHASTDPSAYDVAVLDPTAESTCGMVAGMMQAWGVPLDRPLAELLYVGLIFDTGGFRYSNTRPATHGLAAELLATGIDHAQLSLDVLAERRPQAVRLLAAILGDAELRCDGALHLGWCPRVRLDAVGASEEDLEGVVDLLMNTRGVELTALFVERGPARVKLSLRSRGRVDVQALARRLHPGGGGHKKAAGASIPRSWAEAVAEVLPELERAARGE